MKQRSLAARLALLMTAMVVFVACGGGTTQTTTEPSSTVGSSADDGTSTTAGNETSTTAGPSDPGDRTALEEELYNSALAEGGVVSVWDTVPLEEQAMFVEAFEAAYPGVTVDYYRSTSDVIDQRFLLELGAELVTVDVLSTGQYESFNADQILTDLSAIIDDLGLDDSLVSEDRDSIGLYAQVFGVSYNTDRLSEADVPRTWDDLLDPKYQGEIVAEERLQVFTSLSSSERSVPESDFPSIWTEDYTVEYLEQLSAQDVQFQAGALPTINHVVTGAVSVGVGTYYSAVFAQKEAGAPIDWAPMEFVVLPAVDPYVVPSTAPHPSAAQLWLRWIASSAGQALIDEVSNAGNPFPGSGTGPSQVFEENGSVVVIGGLLSPEELQERRSQYREIFGLTTN